MRLLDESPHITHRCANRKQYLVTGNLLSLLRKALLCTKEKCGFLLCSPKLGCMSQSLNLNTGTTGKTILNWVKINERTRKKKALSLAFGDAQFKNK